MAVIKYRDPETGEWKKVGVPNGGDGYSKSEIIADETKVLMGLDTTATPDDAFNHLMQNGGGTGMDLLWENASPSSSFAAQTISVINISDYRFVILDIKDSYGSNRRYGHIIFENIEDVEQTYRLIGASGALYDRNIVIKTNGIEISACNKKASLSGSYTTTTSDLIPVRIYGIK